MPEAVRKAIRVVSRVKPASTHRTPLRKRSLRTLLGALLGPGAVRLRPNGALERLFKEAELKLVDIGARGGSMPQLRLVAPASHYFACEPDETEAHSLADKIQGEASWRDVTVIPEAIASEEGESTLYITRHSGLSSLLPPNEAVVRKFGMSEDFRVESREIVHTIPLDEAATRYGFEDACFLKLDTQGTELDILRSGSKLLHQSLLGVYVEVEFQPFYLGQPLFSDVDAFLRERGFSLFNLHRTLHRRAQHRGGLYSRKQVVWAHALYLRELDSTPALRASSQLRTVCRFLALALAFEHYDLAAELTGSGDDATLVSDTYGAQVAAEVEELVLRRTKGIRRWSKIWRPPANPMAKFHDDKSYLNG